MRINGEKGLANLLEVGILHECGVIEGFSYVFALLCQDVAVKSMFPLDFPCAW